MKNRKAMMAIVLSAAMTVTSGAPVFAAEWQEGSEIFESAQEIVTEETVTDENDTEENNIEETGTQEDNNIEGIITGEPDSEEVSDNSEISNAEVFESPEGESTETSAFTDGVSAGFTAEAAETAVTGMEGLSFAADPVYENGMLTAIWFNWTAEDGSYAYRYCWNLTTGKWSNMDAEGVKDLTFGNGGIFTMAADASGNQLAWNLNGDGTPVSGYNWNTETQKYEYYLSEDETDERSGFIASDDVMAHAAGIYAGAEGDISKHCGLQKINKKTYYLKEDGALLVNDGIVIDGYKYYFGEDGVQTKSFKYYTPGWVKTGGDYKWRLEDGSYFTQKGWEVLGGKKYYVNADGTCRTGWLTWKKGRYYLSTSSKIGTHGAAYKGLKTIGGKKYLFDSKTGVALLGRQVYKESTYYGLANGLLAVNKWMKEDGAHYYYGSDGVLSKAGWITVGGSKYYVDKTTGARSTGKQTISGKAYYFTSSGKLITNKTGYKIGTKYYRVSSKGVLTQVSEVEGLAGIRFDKQGRKLSAAFKWSSAIKYYAGSALPKASDVDACAVYGFKYGKGDCYVMAATFCWMAKAAGYDEVYYVRGSVPLAAGGSGSHSWCEIVQNGKTYVYDPNFASTYGSGGYKFSYGDKGTYKYNTKRTKTQIGK